MSTIDGMGNIPNLQNPLVNAAGEDLLEAFGAEKIEETSPHFLMSHQDTADLRYIAERYRRLRGGKGESNVRFELDPDSGRILVKITDEVTGDVKLKLTPEQVAEVLKQFESTTDNESTLVSFFINFTM